MSDHGGRGLFQFMPPTTPDPARARVGDYLDAIVRAALDIYARRRYAVARYWRTPMQAADPAALCPERPDPADERPRMRYASVEADPRVTLLGGQLPMRSAPEMPPGLAIMRAQQPGDLDVGGALDGVTWSETDPGPTPNSLVEILREARDRIVDAPYRPYEPPIVSPAAYRDGVARGLIEPHAHVEITPPEDS